MLAIDTLKLQILINTANENGKEYKMSINIKKIIVVVPTAMISIDGTAIKQLKKLIYLGHLINDNGNCDGEVKRIEIARKAFKILSKS